MTCTPIKWDSTQNASVCTSAVPKWNPLSEQHPADYLMMLYKGDAGMDSVPVETRHHFRRVYFSRCAAADAMIGQVLTAFEQHGDVDNTYTMFIAECVYPTSSDYIERTLSPPQNSLPVWCNTIQSRRRQYRASYDRQKHHV